MDTLAELAQITRTRTEKLKETKPKVICRLT